MQFQLQNYNEFGSHIRWHDYLSIIVHEFPIILIRKYDDPHETKPDWDYTLLVQVLGFKVYQKVARK